MPLLRFWRYAHRFWLWTRQTGYKLRSPHSRVPGDLDPPQFSHFQGNILRLKHQATILHRNTMLSQKPSGVHSCRVPGTTGLLRMRSTPGADAREKTIAWQSFDQNHGKSLRPCIIIHFQIYQVATKTCVDAVTTLAESPHVIVLWHVLDIELKCACFHKRAHIW